jgi:transcriptional regulator with XRE-family HTH domain
VASLAEKPPQIALGPGPKPERRLIRLERRYLIGYRSPVPTPYNLPAETLRLARQRAGLSLRAAAVRAETSHPTLSAYEMGRKIPAVTTYLRILHSYGFATDIELSPRVRDVDGYPRGEELEEVLKLAEQFPARHSKALVYPRFGQP